MLRQVEAAREEGVKFKNPSGLYSADIIGLEAPTARGGGPKPHMMGIIIIDARQRKVDLSFVEPDFPIAVSEDGGVQALPSDLSTNIPGVFAGGEARLTRAPLVQAIADGNRAAESIDRFLRGEPTRARKKRTPDAHEFHAEGAEKVYDYPREEPRYEFPEERKKDFRVVTPRLSDAAVMRESKRCLSCGACSRCGKCVEVCSRNAIDLDDRDKEISVDAAGVVTAMGDKAISRRQAGAMGYRLVPGVVTSMELERYLSLIHI